MKWIALVSLICFLFVGLSSFTACDAGITQEEKEHYLQLARQYDWKATTAQKTSDKHWNMYLTYSRSKYLQSAAEDYKHKSEHYADLAKEYRQQANHYRLLAEQ